MLIIFDLDDTLIETSISITPKALKYVFYELIKKGLYLEDKHKELKYLLTLDKKMPSSKETLKKFLKKHFAYRLYNFSLEKLYSIDFTDHIKIKKNAKKVLYYLQKKHYMALVTSGREDIQKKKLINAGIDCSIFNMIDVIIGNEKYFSYEKIIKSFGIKSQYVMVCGDKVKVDLKPAKVLGCKTVMMRRGRGENELDKGCVDYYIDDLEQIKYIIKNILGEKNGF